MRIHKFFLYLIVVFATSASIAQNSKYLVSEINPELKENANAVTRLKEKSIQIHSQNKMSIVNHHVTTILNEYGLTNIDASEYFDQSTKIKSIEATIIDAFGKEIKKIKRSDFKEYSVSQGSLITDNKILDLQYTPTQYPFTIIFKSEIETSNTAFIPSWYPLESYFLSVEKNKISIQYPSDLGFKYFLNHISEDEIKLTNTANSISIEAINLKAKKQETYSPTFQNFFPSIQFGLNQFTLEGVTGKADTWKNFGLWMNEALLKGTTEISVETQNKIKSLVAGVSDPLEKAKIIYKYVQENSRYISIQLGIGGWKPMLAKDVDRLGYGDCKALTNYTKALLEIVNIPSYYTVVYGDNSLRNINSEFVSMQGNHVILTLPINDSYYWLECTSQTSPFGFICNFTDNRNVLIITPEGGKIIKTKEYTSKINTQKNTGIVTIDATGNLFGSLIRISQGSQFQDKDQLPKKSKEDILQYYKSEFGNLNNLKIANNKFTIDANKPELTEAFEIQAPNYAQISGNRMILTLNIYNQSVSLPPRYRTRNNPVQINRGFTDYDEITIQLPKGFILDAAPENLSINEKFGSYEVQYLFKDDQIIYKRTYQLYEGTYQPNEYENFRKFIEKVSRNDNAKIALLSK